ncbi:ABC transporter substrate-binding protein [Amycolatopsis sp. EV170708-02-1]|uniref:ABC transporter substrate-binding protein n=1 Tax=Amycolatopsis sp. EV170708-02-1 TaxID=2919322 RepID=UPI001F0CC832|nr:ABC transporter substrate-binding protein [Amycolatopsis sp. EV170708-02-1]UMP06912.1 ABC transporter substrate-binding protein [Amycolatopsis sp. EV170708-02-1]
MLLLTSAAAMLVACGTGSAENGTAATLTAGLSAPVGCLDPHQTPQTPNLQVSRQLVDSLTDQDPATGKIVPWLAKSWTVEAQATKFVFTLREGVTFSDGTPLDAAAVVANFDDVAALGARSPLGATYLAGYAGATASGPHTVEVRFSAPSAQFLQATSMVTLGLLSPGALAQTPEKRCAGTLTGSGPFLLDRVALNEEVRLTARKDYAWASDLSAHKGSPRVGTLAFAIVTDPSARHGSLVSGQLDADLQVLQQDEPSFGGGGARLLSSTRPGVVYTLLPNESRPALSDPAVRRAVGAALDRAAFKPLLSAGEGPATDVLARTTPGYADRSADLASDRQGAFRLLDAAGWRPGADGVRAKSGERLSFTLVYSTTERYGALYQLIARQLSEAGIELRPTPLDDAANSARQSSGDYDFVSWAVTRGDPTVLASLYPVKSANPLRRSTPDEVDAAIARVATLLDPVERARAVDTAAKAILTAGHGIPLFEQSSSIGVASRVSGVRLDASGRPIFQEAEVTP